MSDRPPFDLPSDVLRRLQQRDPEAYDTVLRTMGAMLVSLAAGIVGSVDAAEDVVQDVLFRVWELGPRFQPSGAVAAYLIGAVRNAAISMARHERTEVTYRERVGHDVSLAPEVMTPEQEYERGRVADVIRQVLLMLPERQRTAFELRYGQGMPVADVAQALGITVGSAGNLLTRATRMVREELARLGWLPEG